MQKETNQNFKSLYNKGHGLQLIKANQTSAIAMRLLYHSFSSFSDISYVFLFFNRVTHSFNSYFKQSF